MAQRDLCPDGTCLGVLRDDGRCPECGVETRAANALPKSTEDTELGMAHDTPARSDDVDLHRELCPDGACNGLIGPGGFCAHCGAAGGHERSLDPRRRGFRNADELGSTEAVPTEAGPFGRNRRLCSDGACIGVLDRSGHCPICGA